MAFTTFVYDTLDVCTRLGRYIIQELTGLADWRGRWLGTRADGRRAAVLRVATSRRCNGQAEQPVWRMFWDLFGASNQLLAALTLLGVTVWLWRTRRNPLVWLITGVPTVVDVHDEHLGTGDDDAAASSTTRRRPVLARRQDPVPWAGVVLIVLAALMLVEAVRAIAGRKSPPIGVQAGAGVVVKRGVVVATCVTNRSARPLESPCGL